MTDKRTRERQVFANAVVERMRKKYGADVVVLDLGDTWQVLRTDGAPMDPKVLRGFETFRAGYRLFGADV